MSDVAITGVKPARPPMPAAQLARVVLAVTGLVWIAIGALGMFAPAWLAGTVDLEARSPVGVLELRAMYGGLSLAVGGLHVLAATRGVWFVAGLVSSATLTAGLLSGRIISCAIAGVPGATALGLIGFEAAGLTAVVVSLWRLRVAKRAALKALRQAGAAPSPEVGEVPAASAGAAVSDKERRQASSTAPESQPKQGGAAAEPGGDGAEPVAASVAEGTPDSAIEPSSDSPSEASAGPTA